MEVEEEDRSAPDPTLSSKKRKCLSDLNATSFSPASAADDMMSDDAVGDSSLSEQIKRFRISNSPGFLRLKSDVQAYDFASSAMQYHFPDEPDAVILQFNNDPHCIASALPMPRIFRVCVPKYYPHEPPYVTCIDPSPDLALYLGEDGRIQHSVLGPEWSPIYTIQQVVELLVDLRHRLEGRLGPG